MTTHNKQTTTNSILAFILLTWLPLASSFAHAEEPHNAETSPVFHESFDDKGVDFKRAVAELPNHHSLQRIYQPSFAEGIIGKALDLSSDAPMRSPLVMQEGQGVTYTEDQSFSLVVWIKAKKGARQGLPIWTNKKYDTNDSVGWCFGTQENGAWFWNMSDGSITYNYQPTAERQAINDGRWHQLAISVDRAKQEVWMYMDGRNVAIYQIEQANLKSMQSAFRTIVGGSDDYYDAGSHGEWTAFNGLIDEVSLYDRPLSANEVKVAYYRLTGEQPEAPQPKPDRLDVQVWNIWHGGHRFGQHVGVERTCEVLKESNADIIGLIETYGSGAIIADSLGYYFYLIGNNLSIMSRYPIEETISVYKPFYSGGAIINLGDNQRIAFFDVWLWYQPGFPPISKWKDEETINAFHTTEKRRVGEIREILDGIDQYVRNADNIPVIVVGDFNSSSHLDHTEETAALYDGVILDRPVSKMMVAAGFSDSYRVCHPSPAMSPGYTWSPLYNESGILKAEGRLSRIDYIYYKGKALQPYRSTMLDFHPVFWPSDHASVITSFYID